MNPVFTFDTTHHALWAEEIARDTGIPHEVVAAPPAANASCSIAIETLTEEEGRLSTALSSVGIHFRIFRPASP